MSPHGGVGATAACGHDPHYERDRGPADGHARAIDKHIGNIFAKLDLPPSDAHHRRVLAVLARLQEP